jgi:hypothetical protein
MLNLQQTGQIERRVSDIDVYEHVSGGVQMDRPPQQVNGRRRAGARRQIVPRTHKRRLGRSSSSSK